MAQTASSITDCNLKLLQTFILVAEHRNFRRVAELTLRSQSAVSAQIKELEAQLGLALFHRTTRSVVLTPEGEQLLVGARRAADEVGHSLRVIREMVDLRNGRVAVGCAPTVAATYVPKIVSEFEQDYPQVKVSLREVASDELLAALRDGRIDFAVAQAVPPEPDLEIEPLFEDPLVALAQRSILPQQRDRIGLSELATLPLLQLAPVTSIRQLFDGEMKRRGLAITCKHDCIHAMTLIAMAEAGLGVAILPRSVLRLVRGGGAHAVMIGPPTVSRVVALIHRSDRMLSPAAARLAQLVRERIKEIEALGHTPRRAGRSSRRRVAPAY